MNKVLVVAAHPDDEILGCGATMAKHIENGDQVKVIIAAEGLTSRLNSDNSEDLSKELVELQNISLTANSKLGVKDVEFLSLPDNKMDSVTLLDVIKKIETVVSAYRPNIIYTHFPNDLNIDHRILSEAVLTATRPMPGLKVNEIYFFEIASSTEWNYSGNTSKAFYPNYFNDVTDTLNKKLEALKIYKGEMREYPHSRSIENLKNMALVRGANCGVNAAEAFVVGRILK